MKESGWEKAGLQPTLTGPTLRFPLPACSVSPVGTVTPREDLLLGMLRTDPQLRGRRQLGARSHIAAPPCGELVHAPVRVKVVDVPFPHL